MTSKDRTLILKSNNIVFYKEKRKEYFVLCAVDLSNPSYSSRFRYDKSKQIFVKVSTSFPEGKRKYDMLYILQRNLEEIREVFLNA